MASINKLVAAYESEIRKDKHQVEAAQKDAILLKSKLGKAESKHAAELASASDRIKTLDDEQKNLKESHD